MFLARTAIVVALCLGGSRVLAQPANAPNATRQKIAKLIDRLTEIDRSDYGYTLSNVPKRFFPTDSVKQDGIGLMLQRPPAPSPIVRDLVCCGIDALPQLIDHLGDDRKTKIWVPPVGITFTVSDDDPPPPGRKPPAGHHLTVGDLCYVAMGQILNQDYTAVNYIPSAIVWIQSPTRSTKLRKSLRDRWTGLTPAQHRELLSSFMRHVDPAADSTKLLAFYYPDEFETLIIKLLQRPIYDIDLKEVDNLANDLAASDGKPNPRVDEQVKEFLAIKGNIGRVALQHRLFDLLDTYEKYEGHWPYDDKWTLTLQAAMTRHLGMPTKTKAKDRDMSTLFWTPAGFAQFLGGLTYDDSKGVDVAVKKIMDNTKNEYVKMACLERLIGLAFDKEIEAVLERHRPHDVETPHPLANIEKKLGRSRLHLAVAQQQRDRAERWIAKGTNVNLADRAGVTALHLAAQLGDVDMIELLIKHGASRDNRDKNGQLPIHDALDFGHLDAAKPLVSERNVSTDIFAAVYAGKLDAVKTLIDRDPKCVHQKLYDDSQPLNLAAWAGNRRVVELLLKSGADVNQKNYEGWTPLLIAAKFQRDEVVRELLAAKAKIEVVPEYSTQTPLAFAVKTGNIVIAKLLLDAKASPKYQGWDAAESLAHIAAHRGDLPMLQLLQQAGVSLKEKDAFQASLIHYAARGDQLKTVEYLLDRGADVNAVNESDWTPLHIAAFDGHAAIVELLLRRGANCNKKTWDDKTPLDLARSRGFEAIEKTLGVIPDYCLRSCVDGRWLASGRRFGEACTARRRAESSRRAVR